MSTGICGLDCGLAAGASGCSCIALWLPCLLAGFVPSFFPRSLPSFSSHTQYVCMYVRISPTQRNHLAPNTRTYVHSSYRIVSSRV